MAIDMPASGDGKTAPKENVLLIAARNLEMYVPETGYIE